MLIEQRKRGNYWKLYHGTESPSKGPKKNGDDSEPSPPLLESPLLESPSPAKKAEPPAKKAEPKTSAKKSLNEKASNEGNEKSKRIKTDHKEAPEQGGNQPASKPTKKDEIQDILSTYGIGNTLPTGNEGFGILDFDIDFALNVGLMQPQLNPSDNLIPNIPLDQIKPSAFNDPQVIKQFTQRQQQEKLVIDPEVLALYQTLNPKLSIQTDLDAFLSSTLQNNPLSSPHQQTQLSDTLDLKIPELIGVPTTFYLHLISMFFTYYHPSFPLLDENSFFESLIPVNLHHQMLLNTLYAIGCLYSRSPYLYQTPFYTPVKASEFFMARYFNCLLRVLMPMISTCAIYQL